jgi:hypothetical protein
MGAPSKLNVIRKAVSMVERIWSVRNVRPMFLPTRWWSRTLDPLTPPQVGEEMMGFNNELQGCLQCKIVESTPQKKLWTMDWWDNLQGDRTKGEEGFRPFEVAGWLYRIVQKTQTKRCLHYQHTDTTRSKRVHTVK